jgi:CRP-like cAMP-binding protein
MCHHVGLLNNDSVDNDSNSSSDGGAYRLYVVSVSWAFSTLSTVGYGDVSAAQTSEYIFSVVMMAVGVAFYTGIVGTVINVVSNLNKSSKNKAEKRQKLETFCHDHHIPKTLTCKLFDQLEYGFANFNETNGASYELDLILDNLNQSLRVETLAFLYRDLIKTMTYFKGKPLAFTVSVVTQLKPRIAYPDDKIVQEHEPSDSMYFLKTGTAMWQKRVVVSSKGLTPVRTKTLSGYTVAGGFFGEIGCLLNQPRSATVVAVILCELYSLDRKKLLEVMAEFPAFGEEVRDTAMHRLSKETVTVAPDLGVVALAALEAKGKDKATEVATTTTRDGPACVPSMQIAE